MGGAASYIFPIGFKIIGGVIDSFKEKRKKKEYERQMFEFHLQRRTLELERLKLENERKILELQLLEHYEEIAKREEENKRIEKEKEAIEKFRKTLDDEFYKNIFEIIERFDEQKEKWIYEIDQDIIMDKCKELTVELEKLFNKLYKSENIKEKINKKFLKIIKSTYSPKELKKMNYIVIGTSGVGKSTLINELCGERLAKEGNGKRITTVNKKYESKFFPFFSLLDTVGTENGNGHKLIDVLKDTLKEIKDKLDSKDPNEHIHCILYCTTSNRFFKDELEVILILRKKYEGKKLPIVIVYTRATKDEEVESVKNAINEYLAKHGEKLSDDIFGITFIKVNAREEEIKALNVIGLIPCFGLSNLMKTCFRKGEQSYRCAIKNSLIQIGINTIKEYLKKIDKQLKNNDDYSKYLSQQFSPNFSDFISFCFEKMTDIDEQKEITKKESEKLEKYLYRRCKTTDKDLSIPECMICNEIPKNSLKCNNCESKICEDCFFNEFNFNKFYICNNCKSTKFIIDNNYECINIKLDDNEKNKIIDLTDNYDKININDDLYKECIMCSKIVENPLRCKNCNIFICNECFIKNIEENGNSICGFCEKENYESINDKKKLSKDHCMICGNIPKNPYKCKKCPYKVCCNCFLQQIQNYDKYQCQNCDNIEFIEIETEINKNKNEIKEDISLDLDDNDNIPVLKNYLRKDSKTEINKCIEKFKKELKEIIDEKFTVFAKKESEVIYTKYLEKYINICNEENIKIDNIKTKEQIKSEAENEINKALKEKAIEDFLTKIASQLFRDIVSIFKEKCEDKLDEFIKDLPNNKEVNEFFDNCDEINENKELNIKKDFQKYIQNLEKREEESLKKALNFSDKTAGDTIESDPNTPNGSTQETNSGSP